MNVSAKIVDKKLIIEIPIEEEMQRSTSGKTLVVASSRGNQTTDCKVNGKPLVVGLNAYIKP